MIRLIYLLNDLLLDVTREQMWVNNKVIGVKISGKYYDLHRENKLILA